MLKFSPLSPYKKNFFNCFIISLLQKLIFNKNLLKNVKITF